MKIKYYKVYDCRGYKMYPESIFQNFISPARAKEEIKKIYKYEPYFSIPSNCLTECYQYQEVEEKTPIYKYYKSGPQKGQKVIKNGNPVVIDYNIFKYSKKVNLFENHNYSEAEFQKESNFNWGKNPKNGFYRLKYEILPTEETENSLHFRAQVFIQFVTANLVKIPEIKEAGKPYQAAETKINIIKESEWFPLYRCRKYDNYIFGINNKMDSFMKSELVFIGEYIEIEEHELEIVE